MIVQVGQGRLPGGSCFCAGFLKDKWEERVNRRHRQSLPQSGSGVRGGTWMLSVVLNHHCASGTRAFLLMGGQGL